MVGRSVDCILGLLVFWEGVVNIDCDFGYELQVCSPERNLLTCKEIV